MVRRPSPIDRSGINLGIQNLEFITDKNIIDRQGRWIDFAAEIMEGIADGSWGKLVIDIIQILI